LGFLFYSLSFATFTYFLQHVQKKNPALEQPNILDTTIKKFRRTDLNL